MSSRRKCEKRHIGFLTSIYIEGISQTVCSFAANLRQELLHCFREKLGMCVVVVAMHSLLPRWVTTDLSSIEHVCFTPPAADIRSLSNCDAQRGGDDTGRKSQPSLFDHLVGAAVHVRGTVRPSALADFRLMTSSNLVGA